MDVLCLTFNTCRRKLRRLDAVRSFCGRKFYRRSSSYNKQLADLSKDDIDQMLRRNEKTVLVAKEAIHSYETNQLPANSPCEDNYAEAQCLETNSWLFGVFDGHAGESCSRTVSRLLFDYLCLCLLPKDKLKNLVGHWPGDDWRLRWSSCSAGDVLPERLLSAHEQHLRHFAQQCIDTHEKHKNVRLAFETSFVALDDDLTSDAQNAETAGEPLALHRVLSGTCACVAHLRGSHLHVANAGDSMAVLGVCNEHNVWTARQLTKEHTIENADEVKRIREEHPITESTSVLRAGRLLGQLYPLRAFGDVRYKWNSKTLQRVFGTRSVIPPSLITPPYLTSRPEVFYQRLTPHDKFLVMASDGLWELLAPEIVVRIISDHMTGRQTLAPYQPACDASFGEIMTELRLRKLGEAKRPLDANGATHLLRMALGGVGSSSATASAVAGTVRQYRMLASTLSRPEGKKARSTRDDLTITIVYFDPEYLAAQLPS